MADGWEHLVLVRLDWAFVPKWVPKSHLNRPGFSGGSNL
jgi:hypothetical protein